MNEYLEQVALRQRQSTARRGEPRRPRGSALDHGFHDRVGRCYFAHKRQAENWKTPAVSGFLIFEVLGGNAVSKLSNGRLLVKIFDCLLRLLRPARDIRRLKL